MSVFNKLVYHILILELLVYLLSLIPTRWMPIHFRRFISVKISRLVKSQTATWILRIIVLLMFSVFGDSVSRVYKLAHEPHIPSENVIPGIDMSRNVKRFYTQRNLYLSAFAIFMALVVYNRFMQLGKQISQEIELADLRKKLELVQKKNEELIMAYAKNSESNVHAETISSTDSDDLEEVPLKSRKEPQSEVKQRGSKVEESL